MKPHPTRGKKLPRDILDDAELDALLRACSLRAPSGIRDRALIAFLAGSGLRISEALDLRVGDVDRKTGLVHVIRGKGSRPRVVAVDESTLVMLDRWLEVRAALGAKRSDPLFCAITTGKVGKRIHTSSMRHMLRRRAARAGIEKRVHLHGLRHAYANKRCRLGVPILHVSAELGHKNVSGTMLYLGEFIRTGADLKDDEGRR